MGCSPLLLGVAEGSEPYWSTVALRWLTYNHWGAEAFCYLPGRRVHGGHRVVGDGDGERFEHQSVVEGPVVVGRPNSPSGLESEVLISVQLGPEGDVVHGEGLPGGFHFALGEFHVDGVDVDLCLLVWYRDSQDRRCDGGEGFLVLGPMQ